MGPIIAGRSWIFGILMRLARAHVADKSIVESVELLQAVLIQFFKIEKKAMDFSDETPYLVSRFVNLDIKPTIGLNNMLKIP